MTSNDALPSKSTRDMALETVVDNAAKLTKSEGMQARLFQAISVQRPVVLELLKSLRREKPNASPAQILKELEKRYVTTVTATSTGVGASAAIPAVGIPLALGLGAADLIFFAETSALFVLAATELHGIEVSDAERARPLIFGMLLGQKSQSKVARLVAQAAGGGSVDQARSVAQGTLGKVIPGGWGAVLTQQLPDSALAPLTTVLVRQALNQGARFGTGMLGKAVPFGVGAVIGGLGSFTFGRDVVKAAHFAFPQTPSEFPESLRDFRKPEKIEGEPSRAMKALRFAGGGLSAVGGAVKGTAYAAGKAVFRRNKARGADVPAEVEHGEDLTIGDR